MPQAGEDAYARNKFNQAASDKVASNREVPDTRSGACKANTWEEEQFPPTSVIITGGHSSQEKAAELDVMSGTWSSLPDLPRGRMDHGCAVVTKGETRYLVVAGGWDGGISRGSTNILNLDTMEWSLGGEMVMGREYHEMVVVGNKVLALGGRDHAFKTSLSTVEELSPEDWTWSTMKVEMKEARQRFSAVVVAKEMFSL